MNGQKAERMVALVDTGFTGRLKVSSKSALNLNIYPDRLQPIELANGKTSHMFAGIADVYMEGIKNSVEVLISEGMPVIGVGLLKIFEYNLSINFKENILLLQKL